MSWARAVRCARSPHSPAPLKSGASGGLLCASAMLTLTHRALRIGCALLVATAVDLQCTGVLTVLTRFHGDAPDAPSLWEFASSAVDVLALSLLRTLWLAVVLVYFARPHCGPPAPAPAASSYSSLNEAADPKETPLRAVGTWLPTALSLTTVLTFGGMSGYMGVKCMAFRFSRPALQGPLLVGSIAATNLQCLLLQCLLRCLTGAPAAVCPVLHPHPLHPRRVATWPRPPVPRCRVCALPPRGTLYHCGPCGWTSCAKCFALYARARGGAKEILAKPPPSPARARVLRLLLQQLRPMVCRTVFTVLCLFVGTAGHVLLPVLQGRILDRVIDGDRPGLVAALRAFALVSLGAGVLGAVARAGVDSAARSIDCDLRVRLFARLVRQDIAFFDDVTTAELAARLTDDARQTLAPLSAVVTGVFGDGLQALGSVGLGFWISWRLMAVAVAVLVPVAAATGASAEAYRRARDGVADRLADASAIAVEALDKIRTVRVLSTEATEVAAYARAVAAAVRSGAAGHVAAGGLAHFGDVALECGAAVLVLGYGGAGASGTGPGPAVTVGQLVALLLCLRGMRRSAQRLAGVRDEVAAAAAAAQRLIALMEGLHDRDPDGGLVLTDVQGTLQLHDVDFHYRSEPERAVLQQVPLLARSQRVSPGTRPSGTDVSLQRCADCVSISTQQYTEVEHSNAQRCPFLVFFWTLTGPPQVPAVCNDGVHWCNTSSATNVGRFHRMNVQLRLRLVVCGSAQHFSPAVRSSERPPKKTKNNSLAAGRCAQR